MSPDDQDYEWPACFIVEAATAQEALSWGDRLAKSFAGRRTTELYLHSSVEAEDAAAGDLATLPVVRVGYEPSDQEIGW